MEYKYRPKVASQKLGIGLSTFWLYVNQGKINTTKLSKRVTVVGEKDLELAFELLACFQKINTVINQSEVVMVLCKNGCVSTSFNQYKFIEDDIIFYVCNGKIQQYSGTWKGDIISWLMVYRHFTFTDAVNEVNNFLGNKYE